MDDTKAKIKARIDSEQANNRSTYDRLIKPDGKKVLQTTALADEYAAQYLQALKKEIDTDPTNRGYAGKTPAQVAALMNDSYEITHKEMVGTRVSGEIVQVEQERKETKDCRMLSIFVGIPYAPNAVTEQDIINAKAL